MDKIPPVLSGALYDVQIIRKTTIVKVNKRLPPDKGMNSNLLHDILGIISGLDLDPVQPETSLMDKTAIPRRLDAIAIQGIAHGSPVDANQDINIGKWITFVLPDRFYSVKHNKGHLLSWCSFSMGLPFAILQSSGAVA